MTDGKTAAAWLPLAGDKTGGPVSSGGLFGASVVMPVRGARRSGRGVAVGGQIRAPIHSLRN